MAETFIKMGHEIYGVSNRTLEKAEKFAQKYDGRRVLDFSQVSNGLINLLNNRLR